VNRPSFAVGIAWISIGIILFAVQTYNARMCAGPFCVNVWSDYEFLDVPLVLIGAVFVAISFLLRSKPATESIQGEESA
jgi:uncharacterized membrane protein YhdT